MKKKISKYKILIETISKTSIFKTTLLFSIIVCFYGISLSNYINDYFTSILIPFSFSYFNMMFFILLFINTVNSCNVIRKNYNYIIRLENRNNYIKNIIVVNLIMNLIWILIFTMIFIGMLSMFKLETLSIYNIDGYNINVIIYTIFYIIRYYIFASIISLIFSCFYTATERKSIYIIVLLFITGFLIGNSSFEVINKFQLLPWKYYETIKYTSFNLELIYSILYFIILQILLFLSYKYVSQKRHSRKSNLYFLINDIKYILDNNKIILIFLFLFPIICLITNNIKEIPTDYIFKTSLGLNIEQNNYDILSIIVYIVNILSFIYISLKSFIKDFNNISNIFVRYNYKKYFIMKSVILFIIFFILKLLQYILVFIIMNIMFKSVSINIGNIFFNDLFLELFLTYTFILLYILSKTSTTTRLVAFIILIVFIYQYLIVFKNISEINYLYYIILSIIEIVIINLIIIKKNKKIVESIGGI